MSRSYARIMTSIWQDPDFASLPSSAQRLYLLLISQQSVSLCGVLAHTPNRWVACAPDTTPNQIAQDLGVLEQDRFVVVDRTTDEILIRSFIRHDSGIGSGNGNLIKGMWNSLNEVLSPRLVEAVLAELGDRDDLWAEAPSEFIRPTQNRDSDGGSDGDSDGDSKGPESRPEERRTPADLDPSSPPETSYPQEPEPGDLTRPSSASDMAPPPKTAGQPDSNGDSNGDSKGLRTTAGTANRISGNRKPETGNQKPNTAATEIAARTRDPVWDALAAEFGDATNDADRGRRNKACALLRQTLAHHEIPFGEHGEAVRQMCAAYPPAMPPGSKRTPLAVASNADLLIAHIRGRNQPAPTNRDRGMDDIAQLEAAKRRLAAEAAEAS